MPQVPYEKLIERCRTCLDCHAWYSESGEKVFGCFSPPYNATPIELIESCPKGNTDKIMRAKAREKEMLI